MGTMAEYKSEVSADIIRRLKAMSGIITVILIISFAITGAPIGSAIFGAFARDTAGAIMGLIVGAVAGGYIGKVVASLVVVWLDWGAQVLAALDNQAQQKGQWQ